MPSLQRIALALAFIIGVAVGAIMAISIATSQGCTPYVPQTYHS